MVRCECPCLRHLDLRANEISDAGAAQLAEGIELSRSITHLLISDNNITDRGALALARALYRNRSLTVLWLDGAWFAMLVALTITQCLTGTCCWATVTGNNVTALGTTAISQAVAANEYLTTVLLHRPGRCPQLHRALSAVEKRDLAMIRQSCEHNQVKRRSRNDLCHRLQMLAWALAVRPCCECRRKTAVTERSRPPDPSLTPKCILQAQRMSGPWAIPWDLITSVGLQLRRVRGAVYVRWMAQQDAEWEDANRAPHIGVVRGICPYEMTQTGAAAHNGNAFDPRQMPQPAVCRGNDCRNGSLYRPVPPAPQLGASVHSSGYFSPRPPAISKHIWQAVHPASRKAASARVAQQLRTSMTSWEGRIARRQARRAELRRAFHHLANAGTPERRQPLAIRGTSGSGDSRLPTLYRVQSGQPHTCD